MLGRRFVRLRGHDSALSTTSGDCAQELVTQHHLGDGAGFGPVRDEESVLFAVFESTPRNSSTGRLLKGAFLTKQLVRSEVSMSRIDYTSAQDFMNFVVDPATKQAGAFLGVVCTQASKLRALIIHVTETLPIKQGRAVCVLDKVSKYDFDGHGALGYSECQDALTQKQKETVREYIRADIASTFSEIVSMEDVYPEAGAAVPDIT